MIAMAFAASVATLVYGMWTGQFFSQEPHRSLAGAFVLQVFALAFLLAGSFQIQLYNWTGIAHLPYYFASILGLWAMTLFVRSLLSRLSPGRDGVMEVIRSCVNAAIVLMLVFLVAAQHKRAPMPAALLFDEPATGWMIAYWSLACVAALALQVLMCWLLWLMRRHAPSRRPALYLLLAVMCGIASLVLIVAHFVLGAPSFLSIVAMFGGGCFFCAGMFVSWRRRRLQAVAVSDDHPVAPAHGFSAPGHS